jgi:hypothetical protein
MVNDIEMASEEITSEEKVDVKDVIAMSTESTLPEHEMPLPVAKQQEQVPSIAMTTSKPASVRPAPTPYGSTGTKSRSETTKFGRKGKRKIDSGQGTSATKKSKG